MDVVEVEDQPRFLLQDEFIEIGVRVKRGLTCFDIHLFVAPVIFVAIFVFCLCGDNSMNYHGKTYGSYVVSFVCFRAGVNWSFGDQDGGVGSTGVVIRKREDGVVKVREKAIFANLDHLTFPFVGG